MSIRVGLRDATWLSGPAMHRDGLGPSFRRVLLATSERWRSARHAAWQGLRARDVDIVIPSYNDTRLLTVCLESLPATVPPRTGIVVVDDASTDREHVDFLRRLHRPNVRVVF